MKMCDVSVFKNEGQIDTIRVSERFLYFELSNYMTERVREIIEAEKLAVFDFDYSTLHVDIKFSITIDLKE